jgi:hypothetical protein
MCLSEFELRLITSKIKPLNFSIKINIFIIQYQSRITMCVCGGGPIIEQVVCDLTLEVELKKH